MHLLIFITLFILLLMAVAHFYWAMGGNLGLDSAIPTKDGKKVINPGKVLTYIVGFIILGFAYLLFKLKFHDDITQLNTLIYAGYIVSVLFFIRFIGDFHLVGIFKTNKDTKFAYYDSRYFTPLCIYLSFAFGYLTYQI